MRLATSVTAYAEVHVEASTVQLLHDLGSLNPAADAVADEQDFLPMGLIVGLLAVIIVYQSGINRIRENKIKSRIQRYFLHIIYGKIHSHIFIIRCIFSEYGAYYFWYQ